MLNAVIIYALYVTLSLFLIFAAVVLVALRSRKTTYGQNPRSFYFIPDEIVGCIQKLFFKRIERIPRGVKDY